jgi:hypothetical protein
MEKRMNGKESERKMRIKSEATFDVEAYGVGFYFENSLFIKQHLLIRAPK